MTTRRDWLIAITTAGLTIAAVLLLPLIIRAVLALTGDLP